MFEFWNLFMNDAGTFCLTIFVLLVLVSLGFAGFVQWRSYK